ncbi:uncharacterized protein LOC114878859 isoform X2 [Osmia bicornis bicornis]|nr:uncharacterized protein LOC114878859 isoform X2 [Osmia bicornis bicornis]
MSKHRDSTCQKNDLPKSLQGTEDAEFVWGMIIDRFPNAAPLLCEMEAVIDRTEDLLQQLRTPCREIETSTSFCTPDSEDSTVMISAEDSMLTVNDNTEENSTEKIVAETQVSQSTMCEEDADMNGQRSVQDTTSQSSDLLMIYHPEVKNSIVEEFSRSKVETDTEQMTKHARSLEEWGKAVDSVSRCSNIGKDQSRKRTTDNEINCVDRNESKTRDDNINDHQKSCIILHSQNRCPDIGDSEMTVNSQVPIEITDDSASGSMKINTAGSGDESTSERRTPLSILEGYSKRCKVPIIYEYENEGPHRYKNVCVIRGSLGGFSATCRKQTEESTKNALATEILQLIASRQIADMKLAPLAKLLKEEMMEVINLGIDSPRETAQKKLYQLCLEKGEQLPKYSVNKMETAQGVKYVAVCNALGYKGEGRGVRECVAKRAAADELYHQYCQDTKTILK